jgi:hypothetical protein
MSPREIAPLTGKTINRILSNTLGSSIPPTKVAVLHAGRALSADRLQQRIDVIDIDFLTVR